MYSNLWGNESVTNSLDSAWDINTTKRNVCQSLTIYGNLGLRIIYIHVSLHILFHFYYDNNNNNNKKTGNIHPRMSMRELLAREKEHVKVVLRITMRNTKENENMSVLGKVSKGKIRGIQEIQRFHS